MKDMLNTLNKKIDSEVEGTTSNSEKDIMLWKKKLNDVKSKTPKKTEQLQGFQDKLNELSLELSKENSSTISSDSDQQDRAIRMLENRLDKAMIKYNEAISIKKTYEVILKRLKEERLSYDK